MLLISGLDLGQHRNCLPTDLMRGMHEENQNAEGTTRGRTHGGCGASNSRDEDQVERFAGAADEYDSGESPGPCFQKVYGDVKRHHSSETLDWENALTGANAEGEYDPLKRRSDRAGNDSRRKHIVRSVYVCYPLSHLC